MPNQGSFIFFSRDHHKSSHQVKMQRASIVILTIQLLPLRSSEHCGRGDGKKLRVKMSPVRSCLLSMTGRLHSQNLETKVPYKVHNGSICGYISEDRGNLTRSHLYSWRATDNGCWVRKNQASPGMRPFIGYSIPNEYPSPKQRNCEQL